MCLQAAKLDIGIDKVPSEGDVKTRLLGKVSPDVQP